MDRIVKRKRMRTSTLYYLRENIYIRMRTYFFIKKSVAHTFRSVKSLGCCKYDIISVKPSNLLLSVSFYFLKKSMSSIRTQKSLIQHTWNVAEPCHRNERYCKLTCQR